MGYVNAVRRGSTNVTVVFCMRVHGALHTKQITVQSTKNPQALPKNRTAPCRSNAHRMRRYNRNVPRLMCVASKSEGVLDDCLGLMVIFL